jgi:tetratricopeptide (TPR) repeat protein
MNTIGFRLAVLRPVILASAVFLSGLSQAHSDDDNFKDYFQFELKRREEHVAKNPNDSYAYVSRGIFRSFAGRHGEAIADFTKAIELDPDSIPAFESRASTLFDMGFLNSSREDVERALKLDPEASGSLVLRGRIWLEWGKEEKAIADFKKAAEQNESDGFKYLALVLMRNGEFEEALAKLSKSIEEYAVDAEAYCWRAVVYRKLGELEKAKEDEAEFHELSVDQIPALQERVNADPLTPKSIENNPNYSPENPLTDEWCRSLGIDAAYFDIGACPFEGCIYGIWNAHDDVTTYELPIEEAPVAFRITKGASVFADSGFVATLKAGEAVLKRPVEIGTQTVAEGEKVEVLHYAGEGFCIVRYNGEVGEIDLQGIDADYLEQEKATWWVRCRNSDGKIGWLKDPKDFDGNDALG